MKNIKRTLLIATCLSIASIASPVQAAGKNLFLLQLGTFSTREAADDLFKTSLETHSKALKNKRYIPQKSRSISGASESWRVLVGPFESRKSASRSCAALKEAAQDCFVVETAAINLEELESGRTFAEPSTKKPEQENELSIAKSESESTSSFNPLGIFDSGDDASTQKSSETASESSDKPKEAETTSRNINVNTHSVYAKNAAVANTALTEIGIVDSISNLFGTTETAPLETPAASETLKPVELSRDTSADNSAASEPKAEIEIAAPKAHIASPNIKQTLTTKAAKTPEAPEKTYDVSRSGDVKIAEAIPVPLTEPADVKVTQSAAPEAIATAPKKVIDNVADSETPSAAAARALNTGEQKEPTLFERIISPSAAPAVIPEKLENVENAAAPVSAPAVRTQQTVPLETYQRMAGSSRVLQISVFANDRLAFQCLNTLQTNIPAATILKARIIKSTTGQAVLRLGPVNDPDLEAEVCNAVTQCGMDVQCRLIAERGERKPRREVEKATGKEPMPRNLTNYKDMEQAPAAMTSLDSQGVWVQLGTSSSESEASSRFETLQQAHQDVLKSFTPVINTPEYQSLAGKVYRLRIGPFPERREAQAICATLSSRGVGCLVLSK